MLIIHGLLPVHHEVLKYHETYAKNVVGLKYNRAATWSLEAEKNTLMVTLQSVKHAEGSGTCALSSCAYSTVLT